ncbi:hypothetical protein ZWY2020_031755 [Hordeum vulgare]|nr:hypothetical protein ZWY2020_031755 [Hordeum vulgare]
MHYSSSPCESWVLEIVGGALRKSSLRRWSPPDVQVIAALTGPTPWKQRRRSLEVHRSSNGHHPLQQLAALACRTDGRPVAVLQAATVASYWAPTAGPQQLWLGRLPGLAAAGAPLSFNNLHGGSEVDDWESDDAVGKRGKCIETGGWAKR